MSYWFYILACLLAVLTLTIILSIYCKLTTGECRSKTCLFGKTAIITGANTGIGYETGLNFAMRGARVILACRDRVKAEKARDDIIRETGNENVAVKIIDMASFDSVRAFADDINKTEERLDILVNNAGTTGIGEDQSRDGHLLLMQINYFSSFLLTHLLIDLLKKSGKTRIVNVSSRAAKYALFFNVDNLDVYPKYHGVTYAHSKLCNILFTRELAKRLTGTGVTVYSVHPGLVNTAILPKSGGLQFILLPCLRKDCEEGAQTTIHTSVARGIEIFNGEHFEDCQPTTAYSSARVRDLDRKVWEKTLEILKMRPEEIRI